MGKDGLFKELRGDCKSYDIVGEEEAAPVESVAEVCGVEMRLAQLVMAVRDLALYVGVPCEVAVDDTLSVFPACADGERRVVNGLAAYTVDLKPYRDKFSWVRFPSPGCNRGGEGVLRAAVLDEDGRVLVYAAEECDVFGLWARLPLDERAATLVVTVPVEDGKPQYVPETVQLMPHGLQQELFEAVDGLGRRLLKLE